MELDDLKLPLRSEVKIEVSVTAEVICTDVIAQRKVSKLLLETVGNLLYGERPSLVAGERLVWRVPVWLGSPVSGPVGQVGTLDVDVQTGEVLSTRRLLGAIAERANALARHTASSTE